MPFLHTTVLRDEATHHLQARNGGTFVDATLGGGGHAEALLGAHAAVRVIGIDRDPAALRAAGERLAAWAGRVCLLHGNFADVEQLAARGGGAPYVDGVLFDLGVSGPQFDEPLRGFSYQREAPLDMRMDPQQEATAAILVNTSPEQELVRILRDYGEERWANRIAALVCRARQQCPITSTTQLAQIVKDAIPAAARRRGPHPARRTFQALRIAVNKELENLAQGLVGAVNILRPGGRLVVISFHSLEDRMVKDFFRTSARPCTCPPRLACVCGRQASLRIVMPKGVRPTADEILANPRSRSATLRVAERVLPVKENA